jgi:hypothetical protein
VAVGGVSPGLARAGDDGMKIVRRWGTRPDDPWAVCHAVRAMGADLKLEDGRRAVDWLLETRLAAVSANGTEVLAFPRAVEVHPNMFLKTFLEAGVPLDHAFTHQGRRRTLGEVADGARKLFRPAEVLGDANLLPWSVIAFALTASPVRSRWTNAWGEPVDLDLVVERAFRHLEEASLPLARAMSEGRPPAATAPVHAFTCGGTHMLYALLAAVGAGYAGRDRAARARRQASLMVWRLSADLELIDRFYRSRAGQPGAYWFEVDAKLKVLGHGQECLAFAAKTGVVKLDAGERERWRRAEATLRRLIADLEERDVAEAQDFSRDLFRQIVGDTCHARRGLSLAS